MNNTLPQEDTTPWYKQFWPWFIMALPASVVVAGISMVVIANRHADDLVVDEYYKNGLAINRQLEKKQTAQSLGLQAQITVNGKVVDVTTQGLIEANNLLLRLSHPLESDKDVSIPMVKVSPGLFRGSLENNLSQRWHWVLEAAQDSSWRLDGHLILP